MADFERIPLGSGYTYSYDFFGKMTEIPTDEEIEIEANLIGHTKSGASLEYKIEQETFKDDLGEVSKTILKTEEARLKTGIMTIKNDTFKRICSTARTEIKGGRRITKIGGIQNQSGANHLIRFVSLDPTDGNIRITIIGKNLNGFALNFKQDDPTVIDLEYLAESLDNTGTLVMIEEELPFTLKVTSVAGATTGKTKVTVASALASGNKYKYKTDKKVDDIEIGADCTTGYTDWDGKDEIVAVTGNEILIVEHTAQNKAVKTGKTQVISK